MAIEPCSLVGNSGPPFDSSVLRTKVCSASLYSRGLFVVSKALYIGLPSQAGLGVRNVVGRFEFENGVLIYSSCIGVNTGTFAIFIISGRLI